VEIALFLLILVLALYLFITEKLPVEITALMVMVLLVASRIVPREVAFAQFGNEAIVLIGSLFVLSAALQRAGVMGHLETLIVKASGRSRNLAFFWVLLSIAGISSLMSNVATMSLFLPFIVSLAGRYRESARYWLMPAAFATVLGGTCTLIGTSTNIVVNSALPGFGIAQLGFFDTGLVAFPLLILGICYLLFISAPLLGSGDSKSNEEVSVQYQLRSYTAEVVIGATSQLADKTIGQSKVFRSLGVTILSIHRDGYPSILPRQSVFLRAGDLLIVEGDIQKLTEVMTRYGLMYPEERKSQSEKLNAPTQGQPLELHELLVTSRSPLAFRTPAEAYLRNNYRISLIAITRLGETIREQLSDVRLKPGDLLLVQFVGAMDNRMLESFGLVPLQSLSAPRVSSAQLWTAVLIFISSLTIGSVTSVPLAFSCLVGALTCVITGVLRPQDIYEVVEWRILLFIAGILVLGKGMQESGTAEALGNLLLQSLEGLGPTAILVALMLGTIALTQALSNQAAALLVLPIAAHVAEVSHLQVTPLVIGVTVGASLGFLTPLEPVYMLVFGPGRYKFSDFLRLGGLLTLLCVVASALIIPLVFPF
jgi:di/tricarboxylate transporter